MRKADKITMQHNYSLAFVAGLKRATDEGSLPEIAQYSPYYLSLNVLTASKGSNLYILLLKHKICNICNIKHLNHKIVPLITYLS